jgi:hypothetical protein
MGYTTDFTGAFTLDEPLTPDQVAYLKAFSKTRRIRREIEATSQLEDPLRVAVELPVGDQGEYYVGGDESSVQNYNHSPRTQPGLWCQWVPSEDVRKFNGINAKSSTITSSGSNTLSTIF